MVSTQKVAVLASASTMRGIEESFSEEERAVISRFLKAATEATNQHAERLSRERQDPPPNTGA